MNAKTRTPRDLANFAKSFGAKTRITSAGKGYKVTAFVPMRRQSEFRAAAKAAGIRLLWHGPHGFSTVKVTVKGA